MSFSRPGDTTLIPGPRRWPENPPPLPSLRARSSACSSSSPPSPSSSSLSSPCDLSPHLPTSPPTSQIPPLPLHRGLHRSITRRRSFYWTTRRWRGISRSLSTPMAIRRRFTRRRGSWLGSTRARGTSFRTFARAGSGLRIPTMRTCFLFQSLATRCGGRYLLKIFYLFFFP